VADAQLQLITMVVGDMAATVDFYRRVGVDIADGQPPWDAIHRSAEVSADGRVGFDLDAASFASKWMVGWPEGRTGALIVFGGERPWVDETYAELTSAGAPSRQAPNDAFWGSRFAAVEDPDGNIVGLMSPVDQAFASAPPEP
jgi:uncharacterized glyoxalase superfamily protein PhnB